MKSKYTGVVSIVDEMGDVLAERQLTSDEIIDELLRKQRAPEPEEAAEPPKRSYKKRAKKKAEDKPGRRGNSGKAGWHAKEVDAKEQRWRDFKPALSSSQFDQITDYVLEDMSALDIRAKMDLPLEMANDVAMAMKSTTYDEYIKKARAMHVK